MIKYRNDIESVKYNLNYIQLSSDTLNELIKSITLGTKCNSFNYSLNATNSLNPSNSPSDNLSTNLINLTDYLTSDNYLDNQFLDFDTNRLLIDKLFITINDAIKSILNLDTLLNKLELINPTSNNELVHSQIVSNLKYVISVLRQDFTLKISLAKILKETDNDEELQRIRFLWLDSPVSESNYDRNLYNIRLNTLKTLLK